MKEEEADESQADLTSIIRAAHRNYLEGLRNKLADPDCPAAFFTEARKLFEAEGISMEDEKGATPANEAARNRLLEQLNAAKRTG